MTRDDIERRFEAINALKPEEPTETDLLAIEKAEREDADDAISLEEYKATREYSGRLMLRIPKELHKTLIDSAKANGVSLNQYALYKLAK